MMEKDNKIRIQKIIADAGVCSRRKAEELIEKGAVTVNGKCAKLGDKADPDKDKINVAGRDISVRRDAKKYYIMLHKPRGFITTMNDEGGRKCVAELVDEVGVIVEPVREISGIVDVGDIEEHIAHEHI